MNPLKPDSFESKIMSNKLIIKILTIFRQNLTYGKSGLDQIIKI
jgi:hypothetical protein